MNLLAIIIVFLAVATAGAIAYIAWELSDPAFSGTADDESGSPPEPTDGIPPGDADAP